MTRKLKVMRAEINEFNVKAERSVAGQLRMEGFEVYKPSWPTFLGVSPDRRVVFVRVKRVGERMSSLEGKSHELLKRAGFEVRVMNPVYERVVHRKKGVGKPFEFVNETSLKEIAERGKGMDEVRRMDKEDGLGKSVSEMFKEMAKYEREKSGDKGVVEEDK